MYPKETNKDKEMYLTGIFIIAWITGVGKMKIFLIHMTKHYKH